VVRCADVAYNIDITTMKNVEHDSAAFQDDTPQAISSIAPGEIIIGSLVGINPQGQALVDFAENPSSTPLTALSTLNIAQQHVGRQVALLFAKGNPHEPVIMGIIHSPLQALIEAYEIAPVASTEAEASTQAPSADKDVYIDGKRVVIEGKEEIVLKCGEASITLTKAGKILIRGKYVLNRSEGVNRIMGGSVQVN
jgi:Domain of unknown function (DUF6484)